MRLHLPHIAIIGMLIFSVVGCTPKDTTDKTATSHPNVVLILTDDQGWGDLASHGNTSISTPTIDRMAAGGAAFEHFFVSPLCAPSRASLLTGRYYLRTSTSWVSKGLENMNPGEVTLGEVFQQQGYATGCFGKWHNGAHFPQHPNQQGFDEFIGFCAGHWNNYFNTTLEHNGDPYPTQGFITDVLADEAMKFIEQNKSHPFFCYIPFNAPHGPFQVPDKYFDKYKAKGLSDRDAAVYGMVENVDDNIARILQKLQELQLQEQTIVLFITDNGPNGHRYNGGMRGIKGSIHEGGVRVPGVVYWPAKIAPKSIKRLAGHIDILPTLVSLCRLTPPETKPLDGLDLSKLILTGEDDLPERLYFSKKSTEKIIPDGAARSDKYRLVIEQGDTMLFDMINDPGQKQDIAREEPEVTAAYAKAYKKWFDDISNSYKPGDEIRLGFAREKKAYLPAHEARFSGKIHYKEGHGWAHDWLVNWVDPADSIWWDVVVDQPSDFRLEILYSCPQDHVGTRVSATVSGNSVEASLLKAHDPEYLPSPDREKRIEVYEKVWARLPMEKLHFLPGKQQIVLHAKDIPHGEVGEIKGLQLIKVEGNESGASGAK